MSRRAKYVRCNREVIEAPDGTRIQLRIEVNRRAKQIILRPDLNANEIVAVAPSLAYVQTARQFAQKKSSELAKMVRKMSDSELLNPEPPAQLKPEDKRFKLTASDGNIVQVRVEVNRKAHRVILRIDDMNHEAVAVIPSVKQLAEAKKFAEKKLEVLNHKLGGVPKPAPFVDGGEILFRGKPVVLRYDPSLPEAKFVDGPFPAIASPGKEGYFERQIERFLINTTKKEVIKLVNKHCTKLNEQVNKHCFKRRVNPPLSKNIIIKDTTTLWGSCRWSKIPHGRELRMTFSWRLICADPEILNSVAAHECSHILEMNHSELFYRHVYYLCPNYDDHMDKLKRDSKMLRQIGLVPIKPACRQPTERTLI